MLQTRDQVSEPQMHSHFKKSKWLKRTPSPLIFSSGLPSPGSEMAFRQGVPSIPREYVEDHHSTHSLHAPLLTIPAMNSPPLHPFDAAGNPSSHCGFSKAAGTSFVTPMTNSAGLAVASPSWEKACSPHTFEIAKPGPWVLPRQHSQHSSFSPLSSASKRGSPKAIALPSTPSVGPPPMAPSSRRRKVGGREGGRSNGRPDLNTLPHSSSCSGSSSGDEGEPSFIPSTPEEEDEAMERGHEEMYERERNDVGLRWGRHSEEVEDEEDEEDDEVEGGGTVNSGGRGSGVVKACAHCGTSKTPLWRNGPPGPKSLCNACGIRFNKIKAGKRKPTPREAAILREYERAQSQQVSPNAPPSPAGAPFHSPKGHLRGLPRPSSASSPSALRAIRATPGFLGQKEKGFNQGPATHSPSSSSQLMLPPTPSVCSRKRARSSSSKSSSPGRGGEGEEEGPSPPMLNLAPHPPTSVLCAAPTPMSPFRPPMVGNTRAKTTAFPSPPLSSQPPPLSPPSPFRHSSAPSLLPQLQLYSPFARTTAAAAAAAGATAPSPNRKEGEGSISCGKMHASLDNGHGRNDQISNGRMKKRSHSLSPLSPLLLGGEREEVDVGLRVLLDRTSSGGSLSSGSSECCFRTEQQQQSFPPEFPDTQLSLGLAQSQGCSSKTGRALFGDEGDNQRHQQQQHLLVGAASASASENPALPSSFATYPPVSSRKEDVLFGAALLMALSEGSPPPPGVPCRVLM